MGGSRRRGEMGGKVKLVLIELIEVRESDGGEIVL